MNILREQGAETLTMMCFYSGTAEHPVYVDFLAPAPAARPRRPIVMLHGGFHTGSAYLATPDGRQGWAPYFARLGHPVHVADWPGHGRSPANRNFATLSLAEIGESLAVLVDEVGPAIIMAHSAAGPLAWWIAEKLPERVAAIVGIAPGPPANIQKALPDDPQAIEALGSDESLGCPVYSPLGAPVYVDIDFVRRFWANGRRFPKDAIEPYAKSIVAESAKVLNQRFNIGGAGLGLAGPDVVAGRPILVVTGDSDPRHPRAVDDAVAAYFGADRLWLADAGISGNGHMLMMEDNSEEIAGLIAQWLAGKGL